jgi:hypothetical protein
MVALVITHLVLSWRIGGWRLMRKMAV